MKGRARPPGRGGTRPRKGAVLEKGGGRKRQRRATRKRSEKESEIGGEIRSELFKVSERQRGLRGGKDVGEEVKLAAGRVEMNERRGRWPERVLVGMGGNEGRHELDEDSQIEGGVAA